ncbi:unnamed protein product [Thelazia callipaeda]|uniref:DUF3265 domain-containing protein n=1 Tax=Thelazia callipaeda TaxID=103827 RepID=A0A0N5CTY7_THECL|nr:unnamed protein product [Thelazia callipaeda]
MRLNDIEVNDYQWHRLTLFQVSFGFSPSVSTVCLSLDAL